MTKSDIASKRLEISSVLQQAARTKGLKNYHVSQATGGLVTTTQVSDLFSGKSNFTANTFIAVCSGLGVDLSDLLSKTLYNE